MKRSTLCFLLVLATTPLHAAEDPSLALDFPYAPRSVGMGLSGVADPTDPANLYHNPANVAGTRGLWVNVALHNWTGDRNAFEFGVEGGLRPFTSEPRWSVAGALSRPRADVREQLGETVLKSATHESYTHATVATSFGTGTLFVSAGASAKWNTVEDANETLYDAGLLVGGATRRGRYRYRYHLGWSVRNIDRRGIRDVGGSPQNVTIEDTRLGISIGFDAGLGEDAIEPAAVGLTLNADADSEFDAGAAGVELLVRGVVAVRGGYRDSMFPGRHARVVGAGMSHWFGFFYARVDYAFLETTDGTTHVNSIATRFGFDI